MNTNGGNHEIDKDEIDEVLDKAIASYAASEPRPGLEARVLARVAARQRERARSPRWWSALAFSAVGATAAIALAVFWLGQGEFKRIPPSPSADLTPSRIEARQGPVADKTVGEVLAPAAPTAPNSLRLARSGPQPAANASSPKLEQFPSPLPLSEQEEMLALYVRRFPQRAAMTASVQADLHREEEAEMAAPWPAQNTDDLETKNN